MFDSKIHVTCKCDAIDIYRMNVTRIKNVAWLCKKTGTALAFPFSAVVLGDPASFLITPTCRGVR